MPFSLKELLPVNPDVLSNVVTRRQQIDFMQSFFSQVSIPAQQYGDAIGRYLRIGGSKNEVLTIGDLQRNLSDYGPLQYTFISKGSYNPLQLWEFFNGLNSQSQFAPSLEPISQRVNLTIRFDQQPLSLAGFHIAGFSFPRPISAIRNVADAKDHNFYVGGNVEYLVPAVRST